MICRNRFCSLSWGVTINERSDMIHLLFYSETKTKLNKTKEKKTFSMNKIQYVYILISTADMLVYSHKRTFSVPLYAFSMNCAFVK